MSMSDTITRPVIEVSVYIVSTADDAFLSGAAALLAYRIEACRRAFGMTGEVWTTEPVDAGRVVRVAWPIPDGWTEAEALALSDAMMVIPYEQIFDPALDVSSDRNSRTDAWHRWILEQRAKIVPEIKEHLSAS